MLHKFLGILLICFLFFAIFNYGYYANASEFGPFQGKIVDADTKEPIEGVMVLIEWRELHFFAGSTFYDAQETLTDKNGEFYIPGILVFNPWTRLGIEAGVIIYKSGYGTIDGEHIHDLAKALSAKKDGTPRVTYILSFQDGKPIIILKKLSIEERKKFGTPGTSDISHGKKKLLIQEINKERKFVGLGEVTD